MIISIGDILVIMDTLINSCEFKDDGKIFKYSEKSRQLAANRLLKQCEKFGIRIEENADGQATSPGNPQ